MGPCSTWRTSSPILAFITHEPSHLALPLEAFKLENDWFDTICTASYKSFFILHPGAEVSSKLHRKHQFVDIIPRPVAEKILWSHADVLHDELIAFRIMWAWTKMDIGSPKFLRQFCIEDFLHYCYLALCHLNVAYLWMVAISQQLVT